jgi:hypothetical protein
MRPSPRNRRLILMALAAATLLARPGTTAGAVPDYQRVISSRHADAAMASQDGCLLSEIFLGSTDAVFGARPGPVNKQGLTDVSLRVSDTCQQPVGKGFPLVAMWQGQTLDSLHSTPRLTAAWIDAVVPVTDDVSGRTVAAHLVVQWTADGPFDHDPGHLHVRFAQQGIVNSHYNNWLRPAVATGWLEIDGLTTTIAPTTDAHLSLVKYGCQTIIQPGSGADLDC